MAPNVKAVSAPGKRTVFDWFAKARLIACLIHQAAYVESFPPFSGSNRSTACINPIFPSEIKSLSPSPYPE
jgi:hypothetical protein